MDDEATVAAIDGCALRSEAAPCRGIFTDWSGVNIANPTMPTMRQPSRVPRAHDELQERLKRAEEHAQQAKTHVKQAKADAKLARKRYKEARKAAKEARKQAKALRRDYEAAVLALTARRRTKRKTANVPGKSTKPVAGQETSPKRTRSARSTAPVVSEPALEEAANPPIQSQPGLSSVEGRDAVPPPAT